MFVLSNFIVALATVVGTVLWLYKWILIVAVLVTWVRPADPYNNPIVRFLYAATEPVLYRVRRVLPLELGGIDFTPIVVLLLIQFLESFLVPTLYQLAAQVG